MHYLRNILASLLVLIPLVAVPAHAADSRKERIVLWEHLWEDRHKVELLLNATVEDYGPYELVRSADMEQGRAVYELEHNRSLDLLWLPCSLEREQRLMPVYIYMGGRDMGHRVCLIREGDQPLFDNIRSLEDWKASGLVMGTGTHWADTEILEFNGIAVSKNSLDDALYDQLVTRRFSAFPRGIDQIASAMQRHGQNGRKLNITVEKRLLFVYPLREIIFVSRNNAQLKQRLEAGYNQLVKTGAWQKLFRKKRGKTPYKELQLKQRIVLPLKNPFLSKQALQTPMFDHDPLE
ncbi:hypothetical protein LN040_08465 [Desulfovibrio subterraneus]|uniref:hypothetical protein n=1 Tax=Desulfovibrio subterraneus TaxID=2718620 RepID=UPI0022B8AFB0|nr:hypothetical protein [Desulfovibrio subterraneus]WBF69107.1 hypothetical protein LN040_08465 [Desulfovibrio subterraneus]